MQGQVIDQLAPQMRGRVKFVKVGCWLSAECCWRQLHLGPTAWCWLLAACCFQPAAASMSLDAATHSAPRASLLCDVACFWPCWFCHRVWYSPGCVA